MREAAAFHHVSSCACVHVCLLLPLMTIGHKAGHYCHFRVLRSVNSDAGRKKKKQKKRQKRRVLEFIGRGMTPLT